MIRCLHDRLSAVNFKVSLRDWEDDWELTDITLTVELGHLTTLADEARMFGDALSDLDGR